jgi:hypothetical protein
MGNDGDNQVDLSQMKACPPENAVFAEIVDY